MRLEGIKINAPHSYRGHLVHSWRNRMTVISRRIIIPAAGKTDLVVERCHRMVAIMVRAGASARTVKVIMGADCGHVEIYGLYNDFSAGTQAFTAMAEDPELAALRNEWEREPAGEMSGPYVYRTVFGQVSKQPVLVHRVYQVPRQNLKNAIAILPQARAVFDATVGMVALVPTFAPDMDGLAVTYYADSREALGGILDTQYGKLTYARVLAVV